MRRRLVVQSSLAAWAAALPGAAQAAQVDDEMWLDPRRQRELPVRVRWPAAGLPVPLDGWPLVLFSHGLGGTRAGGETWGRAWAEAGFAVLHLQHPGSDLDAVRRVAGGFGNDGGLRDVAGPQQLLNRLGDVVFVLDEVARRQAAGQGAWAQVRPTRVGMSGHSFGAHTTLGMAGQSYPGHPGLQDARLAAFVAFSPATPAQGAVLAFAGIRRPTLCITGTLDGDVVGNGATPERRLAAYQALPEGNKALLLLRDADHMSFAGQTGRAVEIRQRTDTTRQLQPQHHALVARVTTDWWRAHLLDDALAAQRLASPEALGAGDVWQRG